jgi:hypothetical protein
MPKATVDPTVGAAPKGIGIATAYKIVTTCGYNHEAQVVNYLQQARGDALSADFVPVFRAALFAFRYHLVWDVKTNVRRGTYCTASCCWV